MHKPACLQAAGMCHASELSSTVLSRACTTHNTQGDYRYGISEMAKIQP
jgi:hypothetical protein